MKRRMKKLGMLLMAGAMMFSTVAGTAVTAAAEGVSYEEWMKQEPVLIGVCFSQINDEYNAYKAYLENYVAPQYNLKFVFSEICSDIADEISFLESCSAQGAAGFIDFCDNDKEQIVDRCDGMGIYVVIQAPLKEGEEELLANEHFVGNVYADPAKIGEQFANAFKSVVEGQELEGVILTTAVAAKGNVQHIDTGLSILDGLAEMKGLSYTQDEYDIVTSSSACEVENSENLPLYIYPGTVANTDGYLAGLSAQLMTGKYNVLLSSYTSYSQMITVVDEAEKALNKDIKLISVAALGADLETSMTNTDSFGSLTLDAAVIKPGTWVIGGLVVPLVNALSGYTEAYKDADGNSVKYVADCFLVTDTEGMQALNSRDKADDNTSWVMQAEYMDNMLGICNQDITAAQAGEYFGQDLNKLFEE